LIAVVVRARVRSPDRISMSPRACSCTYQRRTFLTDRQRHRIRIEVSSSNFPRYDRNANTGKEPATDDAPVAANQIVYHSSMQLSSILLPVVPR